jgi:hypothetical protein
MRARRAKRCAVGAYRDLLTDALVSSARGQEAGGLEVSRAGSPERGIVKAANWATRQAQYDAVCNWGVPDHAALQLGLRHQAPGLRGQRRQRPLQVELCARAQDRSGCLKRTREREAIRADIQSASKRPKLGAPKRMSVGCCKCTN